MPRPAFVFLLLLTLAPWISGCASRTASSARGTTRVLQTREGLASFYGREFHGRRTASGSRFDMNAMVAAHPSYPFGTLLRVTNLANRRSATVRVVDRGPGPDQQADGLIIDVSRGAAQRLGFVERGRTRVRLEVLSWGGG
jgi:rare lipoprotein A